MNENELPKAERHAKQKGLDLETYLEKKHGQKAAEFARQRDLVEYLVERQAVRGWKLGKLFGKKYGKHKYGGHHYGGNKYGGHKYGGWTSSSSDSDWY